MGAETKVDEDHLFLNLSADRKVKQQTLRVCLLVLWPREELLLNRRAIEISHMNHFLEYCVFSFVGKLPNFVSFFRGIMKKIDV